MACSKEQGLDCGGPVERHAKLLRSTKGRLRESNVGSERLERNGAKLEAKRTRQGATHLQCCLQQN